MLSRARILLLVVPELLVASCTTVHIAPSAPVPAVPEHVVERNFTVGQTRQAFVGDTMISVKDYYRKAPQRGVWSISQPIKVDVGLFPVVVVPGDYPVKGQEELQGVKYDAIDAKVHLLELSTMAPSSKVVEQTLLVAEDGGIRGPANAWASGATTAATGYRAVKTGLKSIDTSRGYTNFELIYSGLSGGAIHIAYREHSPDDAARTAFSQDLTYDAGKNPLRFRNFSIEVEKATGESITFRVVNMGSEGSSQEMQAAVEK